MRRSGRELAVVLAALWLGCAAAASPQVSSYFPEGFVDFKYQQACFDKIRKSWSLETVKTYPLPGKQAVVVATIGRNGKVVAAILSTKSGAKAWDEAALQAVKKAGPFPALPASWKEPEVEAHYHFQFVP